MNELGKGIFVLGIALCVVGLFLWKFAGKTPLGQLPGDISIQKENFSFYFPITICIVVSIVLTLILWLLRR